MIRVYIDMDHTFCDFVPSQKIWEEWGVTEIEKRIPWSMKGFFASLLPMKGAMEFWNTYTSEEYNSKVELYFLTRPSFQNLQCYTEKAEWIQRYIGIEGVKRLILSPRKDLFIGDVLIDDAINCGQNEFRGEHWKFGTPQCKDWASASSMLEEIIFYSR